MKKFLSTILTLIFLTLPLAVQSSAQTCYCDNNGNCYTINESKINNKDEKSILSKIGSFLMKTLLFTTVIVGSTFAICKWSPNGELVLKGKDFYKNSLKPSFLNATKNIGEFYNKSVFPKLNDGKTKISNTCLKKSNYECQKTFGSYLNEKMENFENYCLLKNKDKICKKDVKTLATDIAKVLKNNFDAFKK